LKVRFFDLIANLESIFDSIGDKIIFETKINHMPMLLLVLVLFVLAIISPWLFPNKTVSNHPRDIEKG